MSTAGQPESLGKPPIVDALVELRFNAPMAGIGDILPGLLFRALGDDYGRIETLPGAHVPRELRQADPSLRYVPGHRLLGEAGAVQIGEHLVSVAAADPYPGWGRFSGQVERVLQEVQRLELELPLERISLKYVNVLDAPPERQLSLLNVVVSLNGEPVPEAGFVLRTEYRTDTEISIVQIRSQVTARSVSGAQRSGLLIELDVVVPLTPDEWSGLGGIVERAHRLAKDRFFKLLTTEAVATLEPRWGEP